MGEVPETVLNIPFPLKDGSEMRGGGVEEGAMDIEGPGMMQEDIEGLDEFPYFNR